MSGSGRDREAPHSIWRWAIPALLVGTAALLFAGLVAPVTTSDSVLGPARSFSILDGIRELFRSGHNFLGFVVLLFSALLPPAKLATVGVLWYRSLDRKYRHWTLQALLLLGKWSMLDVYVVAVLAAAADLGMLSQWRVDHGAVLFTASILLSMVLSYLVTWRLGALPDERETTPLPVGLAAAIVAAWACFAGALTQPLMRVEKWVFWGNDYTLLDGIRGLDGEATGFISLAIWVLVIVLPTLSLLAWTAIWLLSHLRGIPDWGGHVLVLDEWAMADVFGLAVVVVFLRLSGEASVEPRVGLWMLFGWTAATTLVSFWGRRLIEERAGEL